MRALTDQDIRVFARAHIPNFRDVFMRDALPKGKPRYSESGVVNIDDSSNPGTHWVAYKKTGNRVQYYDSFGDLSPPIELVIYLRRGNAGVNIEYNYDRYQSFDSFRCGHLCLEFLLANDG